MFRNALKCVMLGVAWCVRKSAKPVVEQSLIAAQTLNALLEESSYAASAPALTRAVELLQSMDTSDLSGSNLSGVITEVVETIETDIIGAIIAHHNDTQTALTKAYNDAVTATNEERTQQNHTKTEFQEWSDCSDIEKGHLNNFLNNASETKNAEAACETARTAAETAANISATLPSLAFDCDASVDLNCTNETASFNNQSDSSLSTWNSSIQGQLHNFSIKNQTWTNAINTTAQKQENEDAAWITFNGSVAICDTENDERITATCNWTGKAQTACDKKQAYETLVTDSKTSGHVHSQADREAEWRAAKKVICLLEDLAGTGSGSCDDDTDAMYTFGDGTNFTSLITHETEATAAVGCVETITMLDTVKRRDNSWTKGTQESPGANLTHYITQTNILPRTRDELKDACSR